MQCDVLMRKGEIAMHAYEKWQAQRPEKPADPDFPPPEPVTPPSEPVPPPSEPVVPPSEPLTPQPEPLA